MAGTYALTLDCSSSAQAELVCDALEPSADVVSYFEDDETRLWAVSAFFESCPEESALRRLIADACDETLAATAKLELLPETDWVAESQRQLPPVHAGGFIIHGSHDRDSIEDHENAIEIEAGAAFGTAHHGTTVGCLEAIDSIAQGSDGENCYRDILDLGTGSAVLAIAASRRLPHARILATDIDPIAIHVAEGNAKKNRATANMDFCVADGLSDPVILARAPFDLLVANILAAPLVALAGDIAGAVTQQRHARVVLSGLLDDQAEMVVDAYAAHDLEVFDQLSRSGWATLVLRRRMT